MWAMFAFTLFWGHLLALLFIKYTTVYCTFSVCAVSNEPNTTVKAYLEYKIRCVNDVLLALWVAESGPTQRKR